VTAALSWDIVGATQAIAMQVAKGILANAVLPHHQAHLLLPPLPVQTFPLMVTVDRTQNTQLRAKVAPSETAARKWDTVEGIQAIV
jgi:hypothetical protein